MVYGIIGMINFAHGEVYMIWQLRLFMIIAALMMMGNRHQSWLPVRRIYRLLKLLPAPTAGVLSESPRARAQL